MIVLKNVFKSYRTNEGALPILKDVNLNLPLGSHAIVGKSGSGKSTLLSIMAGLEQVDSGEVIIHENHLNEMNENQLALYRAQKIGIVFQQFHLVSTLSLKENILLPLRINRIKIDHQKVDQLISSIGLEQRSQHLPAQLSGGECQRVAIARAIIHQPSVIFADEPSGNLDYDTGQQVMDILFQLVKDHSLSLVLVTHDQDLAKRCDHTYFLDRGSLNES